MVKVFLGIVAVGLVSAPVLANPGAPLNWSFQNTTFTSADVVALGMRGGNAWPVIATNQFESTISLFPTGWHQVGPSSAFGSAWVLRAASSPDGRVAFTGIEANGRIIAPNGASSALPSNVIAASFDSSGALYTAQVTGGSNYSVSGAPAYNGERIMDMDVSPFGEIGVIDENATYHHYSPAIGWTETEPFINFSIDIERVDLEFDSFGRPHILGYDYDSIFAYDFNTTTGDWSETILTSETNGYFGALAASEDGKVGTAWVDGDGNLQFSYKDDLAPWSTSFVAGDAYYSYPVAVAYDYDNLPVLAYGHETGNIWLAYDPIIPAPEPASLATLLILSAGGLLRRRAR